MSFRGWQGLLITLLLALLACVMASKKGPKNRRLKNTKNAKMSLRGSKNTSKTEPKVVSGHGFFDFGQSLFSCNTTRVLLDFHGFWVPRGGQKTIKKRCRKRNVEKDGPKPIFYQKVWKLSPKWAPIWTTNSPPIRPRGVFVPTWGPRAAKRSPRMPKGCQKTPKGIKREPKGYQNDVKSDKKSLEMMPQLYIKVRRCLTLFRRRPAKARWRGCRRHLDNIIYNI